MTWRMSSRSFVQTSLDSSLALSLLSTEATALPSWGPPKLGAEIDSASGLLLGEKRGERRWALRIPGGSQFRQR
ncbi:hypothetical protein Rmet_6739 (plasmid) [Cupriavidus metallidurans CH34]|uniref:Uncharacterized protein n=1 Tax=Cupriavidus metallidurans (strain ATCC 43123 / DSM 2839 / NBRC 102507 / CH34) TaxID=266264 RepID=D3DYE8_CUPMC|nr:hypothetical protein Rmet_6739 [Cupriavidus metallidurans CH34]